MEQAIIEIREEPQQTSTAVLCSCGEPAEYVCSWPTRQFRTANALQIKEGDLTRNMAETRAGEIMYLAHTLSGTVIVTVAKVILRKGVIVTYKDGDLAYAGTQKQYEWPFSLPLQILVDMPCGRAVCERHVRDLGDDKHYICSDHWSAQLEMIA